MCRASRSPEARTTDASKELSGPSKTRTTRPSPERIWGLLTEDPQISVGLDRQFNVLSLADLWDHNGAALARICFVLRRANENHAWLGVAATSEQPPSPAIDLPGTDTDQPDVAQIIEEASPAFDDATLPAFDEQTVLALNEQSSPAFSVQSPDTLTKQASFRRSGRARRSSSKYMTEINAFESSTRTDRRASRESTGSLSVVSARPSTMDPRKPIRHTRPSRITSNLRPQGLTDVPRYGGSRKYLRGTEGFWNEMFWHVRNQCEGRVTARFKAGIATHPGARALYAKRPADIDEVILGAIEAGLPLPVDPQDITGAWRDRTAWVLKRSQHGVYISPKGVRRVDSSQYADHSESPLCQILILRSNRMQEVDFSEMKQHLTSQHPPASATQTFQHQSFFSMRPTNVTGPFGPRPPGSSTEKNLSFLVPAPNSDLERGPRLGVFQHHENDSTDVVVSPILSTEEPATSSRRDRKRKASVAMETTFPADSLSRATTVSLESPEIAGEQNESREALSWRGLPPPLTTRSRKRKFSGHMQAENRSPKRRKADAVVADASIPRDPPEKPADTTAQTRNDAIDVHANMPDTLIPLSSTPKEARPQKAKAPMGKKPYENRKEILKELLLKVIEECGGMVPNEYSCISDYMNARFRARGKSGLPDKKMCKDVIKNLCTNGRLKRLAFTFQRRSGALATSTILANVGVDATSEAVIRLQQNIINALPDLYVPPLGSVLDAPVVEARLPDTPPVTPPAEKNSLARKTPAQKVTIRRSKTRPGARKDVFGASPARRPFTWLGPAGIIPNQGLEDDLALTFSYVAAGWSEVGLTMWASALAGSIEGERSPAKRKLAIPKSRTNTRTRRLRDPDLASPEDRAGSLNWRTETPVALLPFDPGVQDEPMNEDTTPISVPRFGRSSRGRKIIWKTRDSDVFPPSLPSSLQDILDMPGQIPTIDYSMTEDPDTNLFYWELDAVEYWEVNILKIYQQRASDWTFINHGSTERSLRGSVAYPHLQWNDPNILTASTFTPQPIYIKRGQPTRKPKAPKVLVEHIDDDSVDSDYDPTIEGTAQVPPRRSRRRSSLQPARNPKEPGPKRKPMRRLYKRLREDGQPLERQGRPRILQNMATAEIYRIVIAVIVTRTLAGGISSEIDWSIVQKLCPGRDEAFLADRWSTLVIKNRRDIASLTESMQKKYIIAYEKGEVPCINFDDVQHSNWEAIMSWAEQNLDKNISDAIDALPSTRSELLRTTTLTFDEPQTLRDALAYTGQQLKALKEEILVNIPSAVQLQHSSDNAVGLRIEPEIEEEDSHLSLAKSWALSTVMTSEESLNPTAVTEKLSSITPNKKEADQLFDRALKALQRNQVIKRPRGLTKGAWRASERWFEMFDSKRMITATMLKKAASWKRDVLDPAVNAGQGVLIDKTQIMQDGEMVAIVNMVANGRCRITAGPAGLPRGRYGLDPDATSYNTKGMSRLLTLFATTVLPTQEYVAGDPMAAERLDIPSWQDSGRGKIPCWVDMNGDLLRDIWEMAVSAIVGLLSGRPGIQAVEIERSLGHGVTKWEVETVLAWLEGSGFARRTEHGSGWETTEWWWMVCGFGV